MGEGQGRLLREEEISLAELSASCALAPAEVIALVEQGILEARGDRPERWRFPGEATLRVRRIVRLRRELDVDPHSAAILLELLGEVESLRARLRRLEHQLGEP